MIRKLIIISILHISTITTINAQFNEYLITSDTTIDAGYCMLDRNLAISLLDTLTPLIRKANTEKHPYVVLYIMAIGNEEEFMECYKIQTKLHLKKNTITRVVNLFNAKKYKSKANCRSIIRLKLRFRDRFK